MASFRSLGATVTRAQEDKHKRKTEDNKPIVWEPNPGPQTMAFWHEADELFFGGSPGGGKCQYSSVITWISRHYKGGEVDFKSIPPEILSLVPQEIKDMESKVLTPFGWKGISEVTVGMTVVNPNGKLQKVIGVYDQGEKDYYKLTFIDGATVEVTGDHLWGYWIAGQQKKRDLGKGVRPIYEDWDQNYFPRASVATTMDLKEYLDKGKNVLIPLCEPVKFTRSSKHPQMPPYLLGVLLGDGCLTQSGTDTLTWYKPDSQIADFIFVETQKQIIKAQWRDKCPSWTLQDCGDYVRMLSRDGLNNTVSGTKFIPEYFKFAPLEVRTALVQGLMDTDGYVDDRGHVEYTTVSHQLAKDVSDLVRSLGFACTTQVTQGAYTDKEGNKVECQTAYRLYVKGNNTSILFRLPRKKERLKAYNGGNSWAGRRLVSIEYAGKGHCRCIKVDQPNSLYITNDYIVTHNSDLILGLAMKAHQRTLIVRKSYPQLKALISRLRRLVGKNGRWNGSDKVMAMNDGRTIELGSVVHEDKKENFHGQNHDLKCIAKGTLILMADGSSCAIEKLQPGDLVMTLAGPRAVTRAVCTGTKHCHVFETDHGSFALTADHKFLTPDGWKSLEEMFQMGQYIRLPSNIDLIDKAGMSEFHLPDYTKPLTLDELVRSRWGIMRRIIYRHPYTDKDEVSKHYVHVDVFESHTSEKHEVWDISVNGVNHFIEATTGAVLKNCFDELPFFSESSYIYICTWNRPEDLRSGQRCRIVCTGNPPTNRQGRWVIKRWAPWLDKNYTAKTGRPMAQSGETRWFAMLDGVDTEVDVREPFMYTNKDGVEERIIPKSRTFILALLKDNPELEATGYAASIDAMPEPLRTMFKNGLFEPIADDADPWQVIPSAWLQKAMDLWVKPVYDPMSTLGVDVARGGKCETVLAPVHNDILDELHIFPGKDTPDGWEVKSHIETVVRDRATVNIDVIGVGSSPYDLVSKMTTIPIVGIKGGQAVDYKDRSGMLGFVNLRSYLYWHLRELLEPRYNTTVKIVPDEKLALQLTSLRYEVIGSKEGLGLIRVETKDEMIARIKKETGEIVASPDRADAVVYAYAPKDIASLGWLDGFDH